MNIFLIILILIISVIALLLVIGLFSKKIYSIYREITIAKPVTEVFEFIKHLKNQDQYNKWVMMDPDMKKHYHGVDGTVGFRYGWNGNKKAGEGEQEIKAIKEGERIDIEVRFIRPFPGIASTPFVVKPISPYETQVTWGMRSSMKYPMNIMLLFVNMNKLLGKDLETSIGTLKHVLESK